MAIAVLHNVVLLLLKNLFYIMAKATSPAKKAATKTTEPAEGTLVINKEFEPLIQQNSGLLKSTVYAQAYAPYMDKVTELSKVLTEINAEDPSPADVIKARDARLALVRNRTATNKKKDEDKKDLLAEGSFIQSLNNLVESRSKMIEADFEKIEKHAELKEKERRDKLKAERLEVLSEFPELETGYYDLGTMSDDAFNGLVAGQRALAKQKQQEEEERLENERIENERLEKERQDREAENEKIRKQNELQGARLAELLPYNPYGGRVDMLTLWALDEKDYKKILKEKKAAFDKAEKDRLQAEADKEAEEKQKREDLDKKVKGYVARLIKEGFEVISDIPTIKDPYSDSKYTIPRNVLEAYTDDTFQQALENIQFKIKESKAAKEEQDAKDAAEKLAKSSDKEKITTAVNGMNMPVIVIKGKRSKEVWDEINAKFNGFKNWAVKQADQM
jgi:hypothetical protein